MADSREARFQQDIIEAMTAHGWKTGSASGYDRTAALYTEDLLGYVREAWPERWEKFCKANPQAPEQVFVQKVVRELDRAGTLEVPRHGIKAYGQEIDGEFFVLEGSLARGKWTGVDGGYQGLFQQLCDDGVLVGTEAGLRRFATDYAFSSPSAAAAVVSGRSANGREHWKVEGLGQTYAAWQDQQVSAAAARAEEAVEVWSARLGSGHPPLYTRE